MPIRVNCNQCGANYQFSEDKADKRFRCKSCETLVLVPQPEEEFEIIAEEDEEEAFAPAVARPSSRNSSGRNKKSGKREQVGFALLKKSFRNWNQISHRSSRTEYWNLFLFQLIAYGILIVLVQLLGLKDDVPATPAQTVVGVVFGLVAAITIFVLGILLIGTGIRRLHDSNRSAWWLLIILIQFVGGLLYFALMLLPGTPGKNRYGSVPG